MVLVPVLALRAEPSPSVAPGAVAGGAPTTTAAAEPARSAGGFGRGAGVGALLGAPAPPLTIVMPTVPPVTTPAPTVPAPKPKPQPAPARPKPAPAAPPTTARPVARSTTTTAPRPTTTTAPSFVPRDRHVGVASFYDAPEGSCAHRTLPKGTLVRVTNIENGRQVFCRITDRGPYSDGRMLDLSRAAFARLAPESQGLLMVHMEW